MCNGIPIPPAVTCPSKLAGFGELAQPSDTERSIEFLTKVLEINPRDGYIAGQLRQAEASPRGPHGAVAVRQGAP